MKDDTVYLKHIADAIKQMQGYVHGMTFEAFQANRLVQDGVIRQFEIVGEATKSLSIKCRADNAGIPWKDLAGMRDKLIHQYFGVDITALWDSLVNDIPPIKEEVERILLTSGG